MIGCANPDCELRSRNHPTCRVFDEAADEFRDVLNPDYEPPRNVAPETARSSIHAAAAATAPDTRVAPGTGEADSRPPGGPWSDAERATVLRAVRTVCERHSGGGEFTSDAVWAELGATVRKGPGLTAVMREARRNGWLENTGKKGRSGRDREDHDQGRELTVWCSLLSRIQDRSH